MNPQNEKKEKRCNAVCIVRHLRSSNNVTAQPKAAL